MLSGDNLGRGHHGGGHRGGAHFARYRGGYRRRYYPSYRFGYYNYPWWSAGYGYWPYQNTTLIVQPAPPVQCAFTFALPNGATQNITAPCPPGFVKPLSVQIKLL
jgi:hypothetical protein